MATRSYPKMVPANAQRNPYKWLSFADHTDWVHVDPKILFALDQIGMTLRKKITVISGYRDPSYSQKVGGYGTDPHTRGVAVDAYIGKTPVGDYAGVEAMIEKAGLESGAQPGFYRGNRDPEHIQVPGSGVDKSIHAGSWTPSPSTAKGASQDSPPDPNGPAPTASPTYTPPDLSHLPALPSILPPLQPELVSAEIRLPGDVYNILPAQEYASTWRMIAAQQNSSPEAQRMAMMGSTLNGG